MELLRYMCKSECCGQLSGSKVFESRWNFALVANKPRHCGVLHNFTDQTAVKDPSLTSEDFRRVAQYGAVARVGKARG